MTDSTPTTTNSSPQPATAPAPETRVESQPSAASTPALKEQSPAGAQVTSAEDFDESIIPEGSRDNFRKYREAQKQKHTALEDKLNGETRKRMEFEGRFAEMEARTRASQSPPDLGERPDYKSYSTIEDYSAALEKWASQKGANEFIGTLTKQQQAQIIHEENIKMLAKGDAARLKYPDFNQTTQPIYPIADKIPMLVQFVREAENGVDVLYHLGKNPAALEALSRMQPFAAIQELLRIQAALSTPAPKAITQAPQPINPVHTGGDGNVHSILEEVKKDDVSDFVARENRNEMRRRKGK